MRQLHRPLIATLLLLLSAGSIADTVKTFSLQHRNADELIPVLRPLIDTGGAITGRGYTLIIRSSDSNLQQVAETIQQLDVAPYMLLITVQQSGDQDKHAQGASISGDSREQRATVHLYQSQRRSSNQSGQKLQVLEGHWATIRTGKSVPQVTRNYRQRGHHSVIEQRIEYRDVDSGFEVRPRLSGEQVILDVRPFQASLSEQGGGIVEKQSLSTTVRGRLGEWITLGGISEQGNNSERGIIYSTRQRGETTQNVRIKVEEIAP